jgi:hypothetical protein
MVEGKGRKEGEGHQSLADRPYLASTQPLLSSSTSSCSFYVAPLTKASKVKQIPFILFQSSIYLFYFLKNLILYDAMMK